MTSKRPVPLLAAVLLAVLRGDHRHGRRIRRRRALGDPPAGSPRWLGRRCAAASAGTVLPLRVALAPEAPARPRCGSRAGPWSGCPTPARRARSCAAAPTCRRTAPPSSATWSTSAPRSSRSRSGRAPPPGAVTVTVTEEGVVTPAPARPVLAGPEDTPPPAAADLEPGLPQRRRRRPAPRPGFLEPPPVGELHQPGLRAGARPRAGRLAAPAAGRRAGGRRPGRRPLGPRLPPHRQLRPGRQPRPARGRDPPGRGDVLPAVPKRFRDHGLHLYAAVGDHEYGDNPWTASKRRLAPVFQQQFARYFTRTSSGRPIFRDHPTGPHAGSSYAFRPVADLQFFSSTSFSMTLDQARIRVDRAAATMAGAGAPQAGGSTSCAGRWSRATLPWSSRSARAAPASCTTPGGSRSQRWRVFRGTASTSTSAARSTTAPRSAWTASDSSAHGGAFQFGLTAYAVSPSTKNGST